MFFMQGWTNKNQNTYNPTDLRFGPPKYAWHANFVHKWSIGRWKRLETPICKCKRGPLGPSAEQNFDLRKMKIILLAEWVDRPAISWANRIFGGSRLCLASGWERSRHLWSNSRLVFSQVSTSNKLLPELEPHQHRVIPIKKRYFHCGTAPRRNRGLRPPISIQNNFTIFRHSLSFSWHFVWWIYSSKKDSHTSAC